MIEKIRSWFRNSRTAGEPLFHSTTIQDHSYPYDFFTDYSRYSCQYIKDDREYDEFARIRVLFTNRDEEILYLLQTGQEDRTSALYRGPAVLATPEDIRSLWVMWDCL